MWSEAHTVYCWYNFISLFWKFIFHIWERGNAFGLLGMYVVPNQLTVRQPSTATYSRTRICSERLIWLKHAIFSLYIALSIKITEMALDCKGKSSRISSRENLSLHITVGSLSPRLTVFFKTGLSLNLLTYQQFLKKVLLPTQIFTRAQPFRLLLEYSIIGRHCKHSEAVARGSFFRDYDNEWFL